MKTIQMRLEQFLHMQPNELRLKHAGAGITAIEVEWPDDAALHSTVVVAPTAHGIEQRSVPAVAFIRDLERLEGEVSASANFALVRKQAAAAKRIRSPMLSLLGLPSEYSNDKGVEFYSNEASEQVSYRIRSFVVARDRRDALHKCIAEWVEKFGNEITFRADEGVDLSRSYKLQLDEELLVDDVVERSVNPAAVARRIERLKDAIEKLGKGSTDPLAIRPWIYSQGAVSLRPIRRGFLSQLGSDATLMWQLLALRAELLRRWQCPLFFGTASDALDFGATSVAIGPARGFVLAFRKDLNEYVSSMSEKFSAAHCRLE